jgi:hypothetical protein
MQIYGIKSPRKFIVMIAFVTLAFLLQTAVYVEGASRGRSRAFETPASGCCEQPVQQRPPVLIWKHGTTKAAAIDTLKNEIRKLGYANYVKWDGDEARARVTRFFFKIIDARGRVTDDMVVIERCRGMASGEGVSRCRAILQKAFPGGEARK